MTQFFTVVIVPGTTPPEQIHEAVTRLLAPYDENLSVPPYKVYLHREDLGRMASHSNTSPQDLAKLASHMDDWGAGCEGGADEQGLYQLSTSNPQAKWDWWEIGGRWNGEVRAARRSDETGFNFGDDYHQLAENMLPVKQLHHELTCFAVVTPDGAWHQKGEMGWWAMVNNEKGNEEWQKEAIQMLQQHQEDLLVGVDCHI